MTEPTAQIQQHFYQAIGVVEGILEIDDSNNTLTIGDKSFSVAVANAVRKKHQPQQTQYFRVYPSLKKGQTAFKIVSVVDFTPTNFTLKGCWELHQEEAFLAVYRNDISFQGERNLRSLVAVIWENAPEPDGQFWELDAELEGDKLIVIKAEGPFDPPPRATRHKLPAIAPSPDEAAATHTPIAKVKPAATASTSQAPTIATPLTPQEIRDMATPAKISLTCKLNQVPAHRELPDKQIEFFLNDGADRIFTVRMKPKLFKKFTDHGFAQWVAAISGELGPATETGFELLNPAVQVFEKKAPADAPIGQEKAPANDAKAAAAVARPQPPKAEAATDKRKSLLNGVRMK
jgi:hypothetical protein